MVTYGKSIQRCIQMFALHNIIMQFLEKVTFFIVQLYL